MKVEENIFLSLICFALFVEGIYKIFMINKSRFSSNSIYYFFILGRGLMTVCFGLFLYGFNFNENIISYTAILWFISMYISTYYAEDLKRKDIEKKYQKIEKKFLIYLRIFLIGLIFFLVFAAIRAKYLGYY